MHPYLKRWPLLRVEVAEQSMLPGLHPGDWLVAWRTRRIRPGHVVLAWHPARADFMLVKRAVRRVEGGWWLASDNPRAGAVDSSRFGPVPPELIVGRVLARYWPFPPHPIPPLIIRNERRLLPRVPLSGRPVDVAGPRSPEGTRPGASRGYLRRLRRRGLRGCFFCGSGLLRYPIFDLFGG